MPIAPFSPDIPGAPTNPLALALSQSLVQGRPPAQPAMPAPKKMSKGQMILGILADGLAGAVGARPAFGQMVAQQRQQEQEQQQAIAQWGLQRRAQREDKQWEWQNKPREAPAPYRFEDNAGNVWERGPDGRNVRIFTDAAPKRIIQDGMLIDIPNPYASAVSGSGSDLPPPSLTPDLWDQAQPLGGPTPQASGTFPGRR